MVAPAKPNKPAIAAKPAPKKDGKQALNDLLGALSGAAPKTAKKSGTPEVHNEELDAKIETWLAGRRKKKEGESMMAGAEVELLPAAEGLRIGQCHTDAEFHSSVNINGRLMATTMNKYSKVPMEAYDRLKATFGERVNDYFKPEVSLEMTPDALADEKVVKTLIEVFKGDFLRYFKLDRHLKPTEAFHKDRIMSQATKEKADELLQEGLIKPAKLTLKPAGDE